MLYLFQRMLRKKIDLKDICYSCFAKASWQTKDGRMVCDRCYKRENKNGQT